jgi:hypothetical protein
LNVFVGEVDEGAHSRAVLAKLSTMKNSPKRPRLSTGWGIQFGWPLALYPWWQAAKNSSITAQA